jgi:hypothetical protein
VLRERERKIKVENIEFEGREFGILRSWGKTYQYDYCVASLIQGLSLPFLFHPLSPPTIPTSSKT